MNTEASIPREGAAPPTYKWWTSQESQLDPQPKHCQVPEHHHLQLTLSQLHHRTSHPHRTCSHHLHHVHPQNKPPQNQHLQCPLSQPQSHHSTSHHRTSHHHKSLSQSRSLSQRRNQRNQSPQSQRSMTSHQYWSQRSMTSHLHCHQRSLPYLLFCQSHHCFLLRPLQKQRPHQRMQVPHQSMQKQAPHQMQSESGQFPYKHPYTLSYTASNSEAKQLHLQ